MEDETITKTTIFPPNKYNGSAGLAVDSYPIKPKNNLLPVLQLFSSLGSLRPASV